MPKILSMIGESWSFAKKQPAVLQVALWLIFLPNFLGRQFEQWTTLLPETTLQSAEFNILRICLLAIMGVLTLWGTVCLLIIGKRLLQTKAGRTRTSFKSVRTQALPLLLPYVLTMLIQTGIGLLWALLLIIPGIIYFIRTTFFSVIIATEGLTYRAALRQSISVVKGQTWQVLGALILTSIVLFLPAGLIDGIAHGIAKGAPLPVISAADIIGLAAATLATTLSLLTIIQLYGYFKPKSYSN